MFTFLHTADLHLGMRTTRFDARTTDRVREARFKALENVGTQARERAVDCVLVAGDLFDDAAVDSLTARRAFELLDAMPMPVCVIPGNHDPALAGGVWDRPPWNQHAGKSVRLLAKQEPVKLAPGVILFPCPVFRKTSMSDPTEWIKLAPSANGGIRVGMAHGSLRTRDDLPADDHLITRHASDDLKLDYLALGHWHARQLFKDRSGIERTAYSGVHEPMQFQGVDVGATGWLPYGGAGRADFRDSGRGEVLLVRIAGPGEPPKIEPLEVGQFIWEREHHVLNSRADLERVFTGLAARDRLERRLFRLKVSGLLDADSMMRMDELRAILINRYLLGELDDSELRLQPTDDELNSAAGEGVLRRVVETLRQESASSNPNTQAIADRALLLLYQVAQEVGS